MGCSQHCSDAKAARFLEDSSIQPSSSPSLLQRGCLLVSGLSQRPAAPSSLCPTDVSPKELSQCLLLRSTSTHCLIQSSRLYEPFIIVRIWTPGILKYSLRSPCQLMAGFKLISVCSHGLLTSCTHCLGCLIIPTATSCIALPVDKFYAKKGNKEKYSPFFFK